MISDKKRAYNRDYYERNKERLKAAARRHYHENKERHRETNRLWHQANREKARERARAWYHRNTFKARTAQRQYRIRKYGLSAEQFDSLLSAQGGVCAICRAECSVSSRLSIDHNHLTGQVRGLLCRTCNSGLGFFRESPDLLRTAASYLQGLK